MKTKLLITGLAFMALTTIVNAQNSGTGNKPQNGRCRSSSFVDVNKNGICDNYENRTSSVSDGKRNGNCKGRGQNQKNGQQGRRQGKMMNFVDVNKDGVCDYYEVPAKK